MALFALAAHTSGLHAAHSSNQPPHLSTPRTIGVSFPQPHRFATPALPVFDMQEKPIPRGDDVSFSFHRQRGESATPGPNGPRTNMVAEGRHLSFAKPSPTLRVGIVRPGLSTPGTGGLTRKTNHPQSNAKSAITGGSSSPARSAKARSTTVAGAIKGWEGAGTSAVSLVQQALTNAYPNGSDRHRSPVTSERDQRRLRGATSQSMANKEYTDFRQENRSRAPNPAYDGFIVSKQTGQRFAVHHYDLQSHSGSFRIYIGEYQRHKAIDRNNDMLEIDVPNHPSVVYAALHWITQGSFPLAMITTALRYDQLAMFARDYKMYPLQSALKPLLSGELLQRRPIDVYALAGKMFMEAVNEEEKWEALDLSKKAIVNCKAYWCVTITTEKHGIWHQLHGSAFLDDTKTSPASPLFEAEPIAELMGWLHYKALVYFLERVAAHSSQLIPDRVVDEQGDIIAGNKVKSGEWLWWSVWEGIESYLEEHDRRWQAEDKRRNVIDDKIWLDTEAPASPNTQHEARKSKAKQVQARVIDQAFHAAAREVMDREDLNEGQRPLAWNRSGSRSVERTPSRVRQAAEAGIATARGQKNHKVKVAEHRAGEEDMEPFDERSEDVFQADYPGGEEEELFDLGLFSGPVPNGHGRSTKQEEHSRSGLMAPHDHKTKRSKHSTRKSSKSGKHSVKKLTDKLSKGSSLSLSTNKAKVSALGLTTGDDARRMAAPILNKQTDAIQAQERFGQQFGSIETAYRAAPGVLRYRIGAPSKGPSQLRVSHPSLQHQDFVEDKMEEEMGSDEELELYEPDERDNSMNGDGARGPEDDHEDSDELEMPRGGKAVYKNGGARSRSVSPGLPEEEEDGSKRHSYMTTPPDERRDRFDGGEAFPQEQLLWQDPQEGAQQQGSRQARAGVHIDSQQGKDQGDSDRVRISSPGKAKGLLSIPAMLKPINGARGRSQDAQNDCQDDEIERSSHSACSSPGGRIRRTPEV